MQTDHSCAPRRCRRGYTVMLAVLLLAGAPPLAAIEVKSLYEAEVPFDPADPDARVNAYERALDQVLVRVTGNEDAAFSPELEALFPNPARFVLQFRPGDGDDDTLWVTLDGAAIEQVLRQNGLPVWGSERPLTLVWLAVDWGQGDRELVGAPGEFEQPLVDLRAARRAELRRRVEQVAAARGIPVMFPEIDETMRDAIAFADVWGGFHDRLREASRRAGASSTLVGRLRQDMAQRNRWSYYFGSQERQWSGDTEDAVHLLADTLAGEFAIAGNAPLEDVLLTVSNVNSLRDYAAVQKLLGGLQMIDGFRIDTVDGDEIRYAVRINGGPQRLAVALDFAGSLERHATEPPELGAPERESLRYAYRP